MSVICCSKARTWKLELAKIIFRLIAWLVLGVELLIVVRLIDMELIGVDSDDGS